MIVSVTREEGEDVEVQGVGRGRATQSPAKVGACGSVLRTEMHMVELPRLEAETTCVNMITISSRKFLFREIKL